MVEGLVILRQYGDPSTFSRTCFLLAIPFVVVGVIFIASYFMTDLMIRKIWKILFGTFFLLIGVAFVWLGVRSPRDIIYEAYADETVTFDKLTDHYKVLEVNGKLLTLEAIENDG